MRKYKVDYEAQTAEGVKATSIVIDLEETKPEALSQFITNLTQTHTLLSLRISSIGGVYNPQPSSSRGS